MDETAIVKVLFFGKARELVTHSSSEIVLPTHLHAEKIILKLEAKFSELKGLEGCYVLALNEEYLNLSSVQIVHLSTGTTTVLI